MTATRPSKPWGCLSKTRTPTPEAARYCAGDVAGERGEAARCPNPAPTRNEPTPDPGWSDLGALPCACPPSACRVGAAAAPLADAPRDACASCAAGIRSGESTRLRRDHQKL